MILSQIRRPGFYFGALAALLATAVMIALGELWRTPVVPQLISDRLTALLPLEVFARILETFESAAKPMAFAGTVLGMLLMGGLIGLAAESAVRRSYSPWLLLAGIVLGVWAFLGLVMTPIGGLGVFARSAFVDSTTTAAAYLAIAAVFASALMAGITGSEAGTVSGFDSNRRKFMRWAAIGIPSLVAVAYLGRFFDSMASRSLPPSLVDTEGELPPAITPTEDFYVVSKNTVDPRVSADSWVLTVEGEVEFEIAYTYGDILEMESVKQVTTLECVSNTVGGPYISNAEWTGVPLRDVLAQAGVRDGVVDVALYADDDYSDSIPLEKAMEPDVILAYEINGEPLPDDHGYPLRLVVPGIYGMKHVKWIRHIELVDYDFKGFWQDRGWADDAPVLTMSKIVTPFYQSNIPIGEPTLIGGVAFSGDRGISRVELTLDGGETWFDAEVEEALSDSSWVRWSYWWTPEEEVFAHIKVRAYEGDGTRQIEEEQDALPAGSTGLHDTRVTVYVPEDDEDEDEEEVASR
jgi:DMSO/TMAO reductase YedYZ molybdopterin-dependent catalytic subunit